LQREIAIVGGGICGLSLALNLHSRGIACRDYERVPEVKELGVGITLLPHAMREFTANDKLLAATILNPPFDLMAERGGLKSLGFARKAIGPYQASAGAAMRGWARENSATLVAYIQVYI